MYVCVYIYIYTHCIYTECVYIYIYSMHIYNINIVCTCVYIYIYICVSEPGKCQPMLVQVLKQLLVTVAAVTVCWPYGPLPFPAPFGRIIASCCWTPMSVKNTPEEKKALEKTSFQSYTIL